jgi:hypothetical protein
MKFLFLTLVIALTALTCPPVHAQASGPVPPDNAPNAAPAPPPPADATQAAPNASGYSNSAQQAVDVAKETVDAGIRDRLVSVYGVGTPQAINRWWVIFYDPTVPSHGRAVRVDKGAVTMTYAAQGGVVYEQELTFSLSRVTGESAALENAQNYATQQNLTYDGARALLRRNAADGPLRWRVELLNGVKNRGFVFTNATSGTFAMYSPPGSASSAKASGTGGAAGGLVGDAKQFGNDVKHTFLGIGGDLQEFFTGERTVDQ